jgi:methylated-DNA-[protein]-cysteine S-methyltransferase
MTSKTVWRYVTFAGELGWMGLAGRSERVARLTFGQKSELAARRDLDLERGAVRDDLWFGELVERLQAYTRGTLDDFRDVAVDPAVSRGSPRGGGPSEFAAMVLDCCRQIPLGATMSYGDLAKAVGRPGAARAVANVMRTNRVPIIIPCHRVVGSDGKLHGYSAAAGLATKRQLLELELAVRVRAGIVDAVGMT